MATIEARKNAAGKITSYRVEWYDNGTRNRHSFAIETEAVKWKHVLEAVKHDTEAATVAVLRATSKSPSFEDVALGHIERLINVREYTIKRYRGHRMNVSPPRTSRTRKAPPAPDPPDPRAPTPAAS